MVGLQSLRRPPSQVKGRLRLLRPSPLCVVCEKNDEKAHLIAPLPPVLFSFANRKEAEAQEPKQRVHLWMRAAEVRARAVIFYYYTYNRYLADHTIATILEKTRKLYL